MRAYLLPSIFAAFMVGCSIKAYLHHFWYPYSKDPCFLAIQSAATQLGDLLLVQFNLDLHPIRSDNHRS